MSMNIYAHVKLVEDPNLARAQIDLRNAGFDQKTYDADDRRMEGTVSPDQIDLLSKLPDVESVKAHHEVWL